MLSIKPVIHVIDGVVDEESKQTDPLAVPRVPGRQAAGGAPFERLAVCDGAAPDLDGFLGLLDGIETRHGAHHGRPRPGGRHPHRARHDRRLLPSCPPEAPGQRRPGRGRRLTSRPWQRTPSQDRAGSSSTSRSGRSRPSMRSDSVVDVVHDKVVRPALIVGRAVVFGILIAVVSLVRAGPVGDRAGPAARRLRVRRAGVGLRRSGRRDLLRRRALRLVAADRADARPTTERTPWPSAARSSLPAPARPV